MGHHKYPSNIWWLNYAIVWPCEVLHAAHCNAPYGLWQAEFSPGTRVFDTRQRSDIVLLSKKGRLKILFSRGF